MTTTTTIFFGCDSIEINLVEVIPHEMTSIEADSSEIILIEKISREVESCQIFLS